MVGRTQFLAIQVPIFFIGCLRWVFSAPGCHLLCSIVTACKGMWLFNARTSASSTGWRKLSTLKAFMCIGQIFLDNLLFVVETTIITGVVTHHKYEGGVTGGHFRFLPSTGTCQHIQTPFPLRHHIPVQGSCHFTRLSTWLGAVGDAQVR